MENDLILILAYGVVIIGLAGVNAALLAFSLPKVDEAYNAFWRTLMNFVPLLRRMFDPDTRLAKALAAKGLPPVVADQIAELGADLIEKAATPYLVEAMPKGE